MSRRNKKSCQAIYYCAECDVLHLFRARFNKKGDDIEGSILVHGKGCPIMELDDGPLADDVLFAFRTHELHLIGEL